jgi:hypothetical protein
VTALALVVVAFALGALAAHVRALRGELRAGLDALAPARERGAAGSAGAPTDDEASRRLARLERDAADAARHARRAARRTR